MRTTARIRKGGLRVVAAASLILVAAPATAAFIEAGTTITNRTDSTQTFPLRYTASVPDFSAPGSSVSGFLEWTLTDGNGDGAVFSVADSSVYEATIDGATVHTLLDVPFLSADTGTTHRVDFTGVTGPAVGPQIGIDLRFNLSASDTLALRSRVEVAPLPVPAPPAVSLLAGGLLALVSVSARRAP